MAGFSVLTAAARRLEGKVALITGGSGGIGSCTTKLFCQHGAKVLIADTDEEKGYSICNHIGPNHASFIHCDVTSETQVRNAVDKAVTEHGKLDIMLNNAGILDPRKPDILDNLNDDLENVLRVNVTGVFLGTKHAARVMKPAGRGSIVNTASICTVMGGLASHAYTASKHAVLGLTRNTAVELGKFGIRVNCVSPYAVPTPMPKKFMGLKDDQRVEDLDLYANLKGVALTPEDVAQAFLFLASDESKYVSGHNLVIDGGFSAVNAGHNMFG